MDKKKNSKFEVGYKKPPVHTRFRYGKSGNPAGRPKKKGLTLSEEFGKELAGQVRVIEGGKPRFVSKMQAIVKQHTNKAAAGDAKAAALIMNIMSKKEPAQSDNLSPIVQALRRIHAKHEFSFSDSGQKFDDPGETAASTGTDNVESDDNA